MPDDDIKTMRKHYRQSKQALPVAIGFFAVLGVILYLVNLFVAVPAWLWITVAAVGVFSIAGDTLNILLLGRKLRGTEVPSK